MNETLLKKLAKPLLVLATLIWGSSFVIMKNTIDSVPTFYLLAFRFLVAGIILALIFIKRFKHIDRQYIVYGGIMGLLLLSAYTAQTYGLARTSPGNNAFLTASYCMIVPFLAWFIEKKRPDLYNILAAVFCLGGIGLVSIGSGFKINTGDLLTLLGGFFYAFHIVAVNKFSDGRDIFLLTIIQFAAAGVLSLLSAFIFNTLPPLPPREAITSLIFLAFAATAGALLFQNIGQKYTEPSAASVLLSLEAPFGVLFSIIFYSERPSLRVYLGFALIFVAIVFSETKLGFLRKQSKKPQENPIKE